MTQRLQDIEYKLRRRVPAIWEALWRAASPRLQAALERMNIASLTQDPYLKILTEGERTHGINSAAIGPFANAVYFALIRAHAPQHVHHLWTTAKPETDPRDDSFPQVHTLEWFQLQRKGEDKPKLWRHVEVFTDWPRQIRAHWAEQPPYPLVAFEDPRVEEQRRQALAESSRRELEQIDTWRKRIKAATSHEELRDIGHAPVSYPAAQYEYEQAWREVPERSARARERAAYERMQQQLADRVRGRVFAQTPGMMRGGQGITVHARYIYGDELDSMLRGSEAGLRNLADKLDRDSSAPGALVHVPDPPPEPVMAAFNASWYPVAPFQVGSGAWVLAKTSTPTDATDVVAFDVDGNKLRHGKAKNAVFAEVLNRAQRRAQGEK